MATRDQQRAATIHGQMTVLEDGLRKKYGRMAHKLPVLVRTAGLVQALEFVNSRGDDGARRLLEDLAVTTGHGSARDLLDASRGGALHDTMWLTREVLACLLWYKRFVQSVLGVSADEGDDHGQPA